MTLSCAPLNILSQLSDDSGFQASFASSTNLETPAKCKRFRCPPKAFRRYDYTRRHAIRLAKRCSMFLPDYQIPDFGDVDIQLDYETAFDEGFQHALHDASIVEERTCNSFKELISQIATNNKELLVVVTPVHNYKLCKSLMQDNTISDNIVFMCRNDEEMLKYRDEEKGVFAVQNSAVTKIGKLFERIVLRHLKDIYTAMDTVLKTLQETIATSIEVGHLPQIQSTEHQTDDNSHPGFDIGKNSTACRTQSHGGVQGKGHNQNNGVVSVGCMNSRRDEVIQLRREIMGMFKRSDAPTCEYPPTCEDTCDKKLEEEIECWLNKEEYVIAYGFRFAKLNIIVKAKCITDRMEEYLKKNNITEFVIREDSDIGFCDITTGSCIQPDTSERQGTLGGFVQWKKKEEEEHKIMCAITAKHVVQGASKLICASEEIGTVLLKSVPLDGLDISVVEIRKEFVDSCERKFKDMDGKLFYGELYDCKADISEGLPVYIWGAKSGLGKGILPYSQLKKIDDYIYIEDMEDMEDKKDKTDKHFCKEGDSGSAVCADLPEDSEQPVKVLAILSGLKLKTRNTNKREYVAVKLKSGLQELGKRCTGHFEIYTSNSDLNPCCSNH